MHVDRAQLDVAAGAPHAVEKLVATEDAARAFHEELEQAVFGRAHLQVLPPAGDLVRDRVELDVTHFDRLAGQGRADAAEDGGDARQQLAGGEGLGHVVVGAGLEAANAVVLRLARCEHDDRDVRGRLVAAQAAADLDAAGSLDHPVEDDEVGHFLGGEHQGFVAVGGGADAVALVGEPVLEQFRKGGVVFDEKERCGCHDEFKTPRLFHFDDTRVMNRRRRDKSRSPHNEPSPPRWSRGRRSARCCGRRRGAGRPSKWSKGSRPYG